MGWNFPKRWFKNKRLICNTNLFRDFLPITKNPSLKMNQITLKTGISNEIVESFDTRPVISFKSLQKYNKIMLTFKNMNMFMFTSRNRNKHPAGTNRRYLTK